MKDSLTRLGIADRYTFVRPTPAPKSVILNDFTAINYAFNDPVRFKSAYEMKKLGNGYGFIIAMDDKAQYVLPFSFCVTL